MKSYYFRLFRLIFGLSLCAFGITVTINAQIGYAPWVVFHAGIAKLTGLSIGTITIITTLIITIIIVSLGEKIGIGTIFDMILVGIFLDFYLWLSIIPIASNLFLGIIMLFIGLFIMALGVYLYMGAGLGTGPRDSLMLAFTRKTRLPIGFCRGTIDSLVVIVGWKLGGMVGIGTVLSAFSIGFCFQIIFKILNFDATKVKHETINGTYKILFKNSKKSVKKESRQYSLGKLK